MDWQTEKKLYHNDPEWRKKRLGYCAAYYKKNRAILNEKHKQYYRDHKAEIIARTAIYTKKRYHADPEFRAKLLKSQSDNYYLKKYGSPKTS